MPEAKVTSKGQITIPKQVREALGVYAGDEVRFVIHEGGAVTVEAATIDLEALEGVLQPAASSGRKHVTIADMDDAIRAGANGR